MTGLTLDPSRPLRVWPGPGALTIAAVSVAWLRGLDDAARRDLTARHLDPAEADRLAALRPARRQHEWLAGRLAIKHGAAAALPGLTGTGAGADPREIRVSAVGGGIRAGQLLVSAPVMVSMSHSADFAVAACGPGPVGVDLERIREIAPPLARLLRADDERAPAGGTGRLGAMPLSLRWSAKEAVLKRYGVGLRVDAREVQLTGWAADGRFGWRAGPALRRLLPRADPGRLGTWARPVDGYSLALAWDRPVAGRSPAAAGAGRSPAGVGTSRSPAGAGAGP